MTYEELVKKCGNLVDLEERLTIAKAELELKKAKGVTISPKEEKIINRIEKVLKNIYFSLEIL